MTDLATADTTDFDYVDEVASVIEQYEAERTFGRPSVLTRPRLEKLFYALERGNFEQAACAYAGISWSTFERWCNDGKADETETTPAAYFWKAVQYATAKDEVESVGRLQDAGKSNPRFYMADLIRISRRYRGRWAERTADELRAASTPSVQVLIGIAPPGTPQNQIVTVEHRTFASETLTLEAKPSGIAQ